MSFLEFHRITKRFPGVLALDDISFRVEAGHCHALIGENGAGKSTLGKILAGVYIADGGEIRLNERQIQPLSPLAARHLGIAIVHQELAFCPNLSVAENLCLGDLPRRAGWIDKRRMADKARSMLGEIDAEIDVELPMGRLSTAQEQLVQIAAAVGTDARVIVMDEPTSSLSAHESEHLVTLLAQLKARGITVIYVSHRMDEIFRLCDTVTVLRDGRHVATEPVANTSPDRVIQQMIGREPKPFQPRHCAQSPGPELLRIEHLHSPGKFRDITFTLRSGEVLGFAGLVGAGRSEVAQAIFGLDHRARGRIVAHGKDLPPRSIHAALAAGIGLVPEDRKRQGLVLSMNCRENASLAILDRLPEFGFIRRHTERRHVRQYVEQLRVKTPSLETAVDALSGGNQQKIVLTKWLARQCRILLVDEPTRGVDVGAKAEIHHLLDELACKGLAIVMISSELPELIALCDRILVLREGAMTGELARKDFSETALMRLMAGLEC